MYRITIDRSICNGYGVCESIAPDVFELGADGLAVVRTGLSEDEAVQEAYHAGLVPPFCLSAAKQFFDAR